MSSDTRLKGALCIIAIGMILTACSSETAISPASSLGAPTSRALRSAIEFRDHFLLRGFLPRAHTHLIGKAAPASAKRGIYVNEGNGTSIFGYRMPNRENEAPICTPPYTVNSAADIAADNQGDVIVPQGTGEIIIGQGPDMCGGVAATINDQYGDESGIVDASSSDALHGMIAVSTLPLPPNTPGGISICSVAYGCTEELTNASTFFPLGVAIDAKGNCWLDGADSSMTAITLTEFVGCSGAGVEATKFENGSYGGIEVDKSDNLVTFDVLGSSDGDVNVYKGCNPKCKLISSTQLQNPGYFGHLNKRGDQLAVAAFLAGQIDIYKYSPKGVKYLYSFNDGLQQPYEDVLGVAYNRRSRE